VEIFPTNRHQPRLGLTNPWVARPFAN
jgi:hypothetical protein